MSKRARLPMAGEQSGQARLQELVVLSGKGGTGKTSIVASFAVLAEGAVVADCDVDAADLHLVLAPEVETSSPFQSGMTASIREHDCDDCGLCLALCRFDAVSRDSSANTFRIDPLACEGCGVCAHLCPVAAIDLHERSSGEWYCSRTRCGPLVHARLGVAAESSGKLVTIVRNEARRVAAESGRDMVLIDGPPGIGCPVIASLSGATAVLLVSEPTCSGAHDLERVLQLTRHFPVSTALCINRWDLNPVETERIEELARERGVPVLGRIGYDPAVTAAQVAGQTVVEHNGGPAAKEIKALWQAVHQDWLTALPHRQPHSQKKDGLSRGPSEQGG